MADKIVVVVRSYPRLSETFIAQELLELERHGMNLFIVALRPPDDDKLHPIHREIAAPVKYLPEFLLHEPWRVAKAWWQARRLPGYREARRAFFADLWRDRTQSRIRRFGQALVLVAEMPQGAIWLHAHFLNRPASVAAYASPMSGLSWTCSAHARDIWTTPEWELRQKLRASRWVVTCTRVGAERLRQLAFPPDKVHFTYHGIDLSRFSPPEPRHAQRDGADFADPVAILSIGRAVEKKGLDVLLEALALLPKELAWRLIHVGGGELLDRLRALGSKLSLENRIEWRGPRTQEEILSLYRAVDLFVLPSRIAGDGDRDGLPNVILEAASQRLTIVSTSLPGPTEFLRHDRNGVVVEPDDPAALARALERVIRDPGLRASLGAAAEDAVRSAFDHRRGIRVLLDLFAGSGVVRPVENRAAE
jgi:glycosyltransferase involved in cell wall biosynthesis